MQQPNAIQRLSKLGSYLYGDGCSFIIPYFICYLLCWGLKVPIPITTGVFEILHLLNILILGFFIWNKIKTCRLSLADTVFWSMLAFSLLLVGAYMEYPSDSWEHFRRLFQWQQVDFIDEYRQRFKFAYFWGWTLLHRVEPLHRRIALDLYSTFWQLLVAYQLFVFVRTLGVKKHWCFAQVVAFLALFGTNVFSFRYYALSSTPLAYIAYLQALTILYRVKPKQQAELSKLAILLPLIALNHLQSMLFLAISGFVIIAYRYTLRLSSAGLRALRRFVSAVIALGICAGFVTLKFAPQLYQGFSEGQLTLFGSHRIWDPSLRYLETLGAHGALAAVSAVLLFRSHKLLSCLTLAPLFVLLFPPTALLATLAIQDKLSMYRILYTFPTSIMLVTAIMHLETLISDKLTFLRKPQAQFLLSLVIIVALSISPNPPWYGRLWFQLYVPPNELSLTDIDQTAQWFSANRETRDQPRCWVLTDTVTHLALVSHLGWKRHSHRIQPRRLTEKITSVEKIIDLHERGRVCAVLVADLDKLPLIPRSEVAARSGHWFTDWANRKAFTAQAFVDSTNKLTEHGWVATAVPPFYTLYEPALDKRQNNWLY